nr:hypothetical protein [Paenisporosarcina sp. OV554]
MKKALAFLFVARPRVKTIDKNQLIQERFKVEKRKQNAGNPPNNTNKIPEHHRGTGSLISLRGDPSYVTVQVF